MAEFSVPVAAKCCKTCREEKPLTAFWCRGSFADCSACAGKKRKAVYAAKAALRFKGISISPPERVCRVCGETKPLESFPSLVQVRHGEKIRYHNHRCKSCRQDSRRTEALENGLKRSPRAILQSGEVVHPIKLCGKCGNTKPIEQFAVKTYKFVNGERQPRAISTHCIECIQKNKGHYYDRKNEHLKRYQAERRALDPAGERIARNARYLKKILRKYGMSLDEYYERLESQAGKCEICGDPQDRLHVDHCHASGKVRGLLCRACNQALGLARDDPKRLEALRDYILKYSFK